ncbi:MAG: reverse transcriptase domain-containing protein [bacterium]|nr:reverse transcriptase domain-containing protein [bacterium]
MTADELKQSERKTFMVDNSSRSIVFRAINLFKELAEVDLQAHPLEWICIEYTSGLPKYAEKASKTGNRRAVRLAAYPDQWETIEQALALAQTRIETNDRSLALRHICESVLDHYTPPACGGDLGGSQLGSSSGPSPAEHGCAASGETADSPSVEACSATRASQVGSHAALASVTESGSGCAPIEGLSRPPHQSSDGSNTSDVFSGPGSDAYRVAEVDTSSAVSTPMAGADKDLPGGTQSPWPGEMRKRLRSSLEYSAFRQLGAHLGSLGGVAVALESLEGFGPPIRSYPRAKPAGGYRTIEAPRDDLKLLQRLARQLLQQPWTPSPIAFGVHGRPYWHGARRHLCSQWVGTTDIHNCHPSVSRDSVSRLLESLEIESDVVDVLVDVLALRGHLIQGSPASPIFLELLFFGLDRRIATFAAARGLAVSRVADDWAISGAQQCDVTEAIEFIRHGLQALQLRLNERKTRILPRRRMPTVCGLRVDQHRLILPRQSRRSIELRVRRVARSGGSDLDFDAATGAIHHVAQFHPGLGRRLRDQLDRAMSNCGSC